MQRRFWTKEEDRLFKKLYPNNYSIDVAKKLKRSVRSIYARARTLGLCKSKAFIKMELAKQAERLKKVGIPYRIKKGSIPPNKGKKMPIHVYKAAKKTMFKKGHRPANTLYNGAITTRPDSKGRVYKFIRIKKGKWELLHRKLWMDAHGKIPKGHIVKFKDGNSLNVKLSNLVLRKMSDNMLDNTIHRLPPDIKEVILIKTRIKRKIKKLRNGKK